MSRRRLDDLIARLRRRGLARDAQIVAELGHAANAVERPPGILSRWSGAARRRVTAQWRLAVDEWSESREAFRLVREKVARGVPLEAAEADAVRAQMLDLVKTLPAGAVAAATAVVPVPGVMLVTPWLLSRLGLLPSRWREEAVLVRLRDEARRLRELGEAGGAAELDAMAEEISEQSRDREEAAARSAVLTHWDADGNGALDKAERAAYDIELARLAGQVPIVGPARRWYLSLAGDVIGPVRFGETATADPALPLVVCLDGESGWVRLTDLRAAAGFTPDAS